MGQYKSPHINSLIRLISLTNIFLATMVVVNRVGGR
jgi:hypothetical protein